MFQLDLKRASLAIAAARLDEAFELLTTSADRTHRDAQKLIDQLTDRFVERATQHLAANRVDEARQDADRAVHLAGNRLDVAELLNSIRKNSHIRQSEQQGRNQILQAVKQQADAGRFSLGKRLLNQLPKDQLSQRGQRAADEAELMLTHRRQITEELVQQISIAAKNDSPEKLLATIQSLNPADQSHPQICGFRDSSIQAVCEQGQAAVQEGRIDRAVAALEVVRPWQHPAAEELSRLVSCCSDTNAAIARQDYASAETSLRILNQLIQAKWIAGSLKQVQTIQEQLKEYQAGPLGMLKHFDQTVLQSFAEKPKPKQHRSPAFDPAIGPSTDTSRILQVDGIGSLLLQTQDVVTIGKASRSEPVDVELLTEGLRAPVVIRRTGEDYFVESAAPFLVNQRETQRHLLQHADSISLGHRGRLKFSRPVAASGSAVLNVSGARLKRQDVRHIVLLDDSVLFGAAGCHFKLPDTRTPLLLHRTEHGYAVRELGSEPHPLTANQPTEVGSVRFALQDQSVFA